MNENELILKALANRRRLAIVKILKQKREASVGEIAESIRLSFKATSKHLGILLKADLVERDQRGLTAFYVLNGNQRSYVRSLISSL